MHALSWDEEKTKLFRVLWEKHRLGTISEEQMKKIFMFQTTQGLRAKARQLGLEMGRKNRMVDIEEIRKLLTEIGIKPSEDNGEITQQAINAFSE